MVRGAGRSGEAPKSVRRAIIDYVNDQHLKRELREGAGCPLPLAHVYLAERFGGWPWAIKQAPADDVLYYFNVMRAEADGQEAVGDAPDDEFVEIDDSYYEEL